MPQLPPHTFCEGLLRGFRGYPSGQASETTDRHGTKGRYRCHANSRLRHRSETRKSTTPGHLPGSRWRVRSATQVQQDHAEEDHQAARENGPDPRLFLEHHIADDQGEEDFSLLGGLDI
jgi:hypothetical protein